LKETIIKGIKHHGLSLIIIQQPCPTFNNINSKAWYDGKDRLDPSTKNPIPRLYKLEETGYDGIVHNSNETFQKYLAALAKAQEWGDKIPIGVFYQNELTPTYQERISQRIPKYLEQPPAKQPIGDSKGYTVTSLKKMLTSFIVT